MVQHSAIPLAPWKRLSLLGVFLWLCGMLVFFFLYPEAMAWSLKIFSFCSCLWALSLVAPDVTPTVLKKSDAIKTTCCALLLSLLLEFALYDLSHAADFFLAPTHFLLPPWPIWLGLWGFFASNVTLQHYTFYHLGQPSMMSSVLLRCTKVYHDMAWRRAFSFLSFGINLAAIYVLSDLLLFAALTYWPAFTNTRGSLLPSAGVLLLALVMAFVYSVNTLSSRHLFVFKNYIAIFLALIFCGVAVVLSILLNQKFYTWIGEEASIIEVTTLPLAHPEVIIFSSFFVAITPMMASILVKYTKEVRRKTLASISVTLPMLFYMGLTLPNVWMESILHQRELFIALGLTFLILVLPRKTTADFLTGALPVPKQKIILPIKSGKLLPLHCLVLFNFFVLFNVSGALGVCVIITAMGVCAAWQGVVGVCAYIAATYRAKLTTS